MFIIIIIYFSHADGVQVKDRKHRKRETEYKGT